MLAYVIVDISIHDPVEMAKYQKLTPDTLAEYGGKFVVRGGQVTPMEGGWNPERIVVLEFPSVERAQEWWNSDQYASAKAIRQRAAETSMIIVEGVKEEKSGWDLSVMN